MGSSMTAASSRTAMSAIVRRLRYASSILSRRILISACNTNSGLMFSRVNVIPIRHEFHLYRRRWSSGVGGNISTTGPSGSSVDLNAKGQSSGERHKANDSQGYGESQKARDAPKEVRGGPVSWASFFLLIASGAGVIYYYDKEKKRHIEEIRNAANAVKEGPSAGKAAIGGPFNLINHEGKQVTEKDFMGRWTLIYFGFTHCPDICPDELQKIAAAIDKIKEKAKIDVLPVFISVDPERDTVEQVREYVKEFHPHLVGLTGGADEIRKAARAYRVYYMKTSEEGDDYLVDHSIIMYLMAPDMEFVKFFGKNYDADTLADSIIKEIRQYKM